jgi:hypothetical protein
MHDSQRRGSGGGSHVIQRATDGSTVGKRTLVQSYPTGAETSPSPPAGALPAPVRAKMESYFQADFAAVRVREDDRAKQLGAIAYAQGDELVFRPGAYDPASRRGQELIGHELAHVVQQRQGRAAMPEATGATGAAPVQRYRDVDMGNGRVHLSDRGSMFVHVNPTSRTRRSAPRPRRCSGRRPRSPRRGRSSTCRPRRSRTATRGSSRGSWVRRRRRAGSTATPRTRTTPRSPPAARGWAWRPTATTPRAW